MPLDADKHATRMRTLLERERGDELEDNKRLLATLPSAELQRRGLLLTKIISSGVSTGLEGRCLVTLESTTPDEPLPAHRFRSGDLVCLEPSKKGTRASSGADEEPETADGTVFKAQDRRIVVSFDDAVPSSLLDRPVRLVRNSSDLPFKRMLTAVDALPSALSSGHSVVAAALGITAPTFFSPVPSPLIPYDRGLNPPQLDAVRFALSADSVALIHGPPGTGKTTTAVEIIRQIVKRDGPATRLLVCGPSNVSVDNLAERLLQTDLKVLRLGHPARVLASVSDATLDAQLSRGDSAAVIREMRKEADTLLAQLRGRAPRDKKREMRDTLRELRKDMRQREAKVLREMIGGAHVVLSTLSGAASHHIANRKFDYVLIDEVSQALEADCWIAVLKGRKAILCGDPMQLPPTISSEEKDVQRALAVTLFDRIRDAWAVKKESEEEGKSDEKGGKSDGKGAKTDKKDGKTGKNGKKASKIDASHIIVEHVDSPVVRLLTVQYRMHETIMNWSSRALYGGRLTADPSVATRLLSDLPNVTSTSETSVPLMFIDTAGLSMDEAPAAHGDSRRNDGEAHVTNAYVRTLVDAGVDPRDIAVITPYNAQVQAIEALLRVDMPQSLEIGSVDGFQGREKEAIVISLVRSNDERDVGFLSEPRRLNVAITRAKRHVCVIGDSETLEAHPFLAKLYDYLNENAELYTADMYTSV